MKIGESVTTIGDHAFYGCIGLTSLTIPDSVTTIGEGAFYGCTQVIEIENGVSYVDKWAIDFDDSVAEVILRNDAVGIADYAFGWCYNLTSVVIPDLVTTIGGHAFSGCDNLQQINWDAVAVNDFDYHDNVFYNSGTANCMTVTFSDRVQRIPSYAFYDCASLTSVTIGESVMTIGDSAFYGCIRLTSLTIPDSVTTIGGNAFARCYGLTAVTLEDTEGWQMSTSESFDEYTPLPAESLADPAMVAQYLIGYSDYRYYIRKV